MEEIFLYENDSRSRYISLENIVFECSGNYPDQFNSTSGTTISFAIVYNHYIECYIKSRCYGQNLVNYNLHWRLYKKYDISFIPDINLIASELKKYETIMQPPHGYKVSVMYGVDMIINILKINMNIIS